MVRFHAGSPIRRTAVFLIVVWIALLTGCAQRGGSPALSATATVLLSPTAPSAVTPAPTSGATIQPTAASTPAPTRKHRPTVDAVATPAPGVAGNGGTSCPCLSADGRYVAYASSSDNLVHGDTNDSWDIFVHDLATRATERVSVSSDGEQANDMSFDLSISADGRWVAFASTADNLVPGDTNAVGDIFVRDRVTGRTELISIGFDGGPANAASDDPAISADGRTVTFHSKAGNLVRGEGPASRSTYYVCDLDTHTIRRADTDPEDDTEVSADERWELYSVREPYPTATPGPTPSAAPGGAPRWTTLYLRERSTGETWTVSRFLEPRKFMASCLSHTRGSRISADGRWVAYLRPSAEGNRYDAVYLYDRETGESRLVSVAVDGGLPNHDCYGPSISADGSVIAFGTLANNLLPDTTTRSTGVYVVDRDTGRIRRADVASP